MTLPFAYSQASDAGSTLPRPMRNRLNKTGRFQQWANQDLLPSLDERQERGNRLQGQADDALADPVGTAGLFRGFYQDAAEGFTAPAMRAFQSQSQELGANVASRFGGNVSGEEIRQTNAFQDQFSRNLAEQLAGLAPQAAQQGMAYTGQLQQAAGNATGEADILRQLLLSGILGTKRGRKKKGGGILGAIGGAIGGVASGLLPGIGDKLAGEL